MSPRGRRVQLHRTSGKKRNEKIKRERGREKQRIQTPTGGGGGQQASFAVQHLLHGRRFAPSCRGRRHSDPFLFSPLGHSREARAPKRYVQISRLQFNQYACANLLSRELFRILPRDIQPRDFSRTSSRMCASRTQFGSASN